MFAIYQVIYVQPNEVITFSEFCFVEECGHIVRAQIAIAGCHVRILVSVMTQSIDRGQLTVLRRVGVCHVLIRLRVI